MDKSVRDFDPDAVERRRREIGLSLSELARRAGVARTGQLRAWLQGRACPTPRYLRALAGVLGVAPQALTRGDLATASLRELRMWAGYTQQELAEAAGIGASRYAAMEQGRQARVRDEPRVTAALARALQTDVGTVRAALARTKAARTRAVASAAAASGAPGTPRPRGRRASRPGARAPGGAAEGADRDDAGELLSISDVAKILGVHLSTAHRHARNGKLPARRLGAGSYYVVKRELLEWLRQQDTAEERQDTAQGTHNRR